MLQLLLGCAGSGKTSAVDQAVREWIENGGQGHCMVLVPEQSSFETERRVLRQLGARDSQRVEVFSFRRLADQAFRQYGKPAGRVLTEGGRKILMSLALEQAEPQLSFYRGYTDMAELINLLLSFEKELKLCGVSTEAFLGLEDQAAEETLRTKIRDMGLILSAYEALTARSYLDPMDDLRRILPLIEEHRMFDGYQIFVDGFKDFTVQEADVLRLMLRQAGAVTVSLCTDRAHAGEPGRELFLPVCRTASLLMRMARENGVAVAKHRVLEPGRRFRAEELAFLEQNLFRARREAWEQPVEAVQCFCGANRHDEAAFVAQEIRRLVMEQGYRYRDFAVICRNLAPYRGVLDDVFDRHEIAYFLDDPRRVESEPLMQTVLSALRILSAGYDSETVFTYLKAGMVAGISPYEISLLENYTYLWSIGGKQWKAEWTANPSGFSGGFSGEEKAQLAELNRLREKLTAPLERLNGKLQNRTGLEISEALYDFLLEIGADQCVVALTERLREMGQYTVAEEQLRLWDLLMETLDQMALALGETAVSRERYGSLLQLLLSSAEISGIPEGVDQVSVGEAGRVRLTDPKVVFVIGAVQDEFPAQVTEDSAFSDCERREMIALGLPLVSTLDSREADETFLGYTSLTSGGERLYLTWYAAGLAGEAKRPSSLVREVLSILPRSPVHSRELLPKEREACSRETAFALFAKEYRADSALAATLRELFREEPDYADRCRALARVAEGRPRSFADPEKARLIFPKTMRLSSSQVETYHLCQFRYFCQYGLRLKERKPAEVTALEYGSLMHYLLEQLFRNYGHKSIHGMDDAALGGVIREAILRYTAERLGGAGDKTPQFLFLLERLAGAAAVVIRRVAEELEQSAFQPIGYEMTLGPGGDFPPLRLPLPDGSEVSVDGVIDRVDLYVENGEQYVRIIDYKTGRKDFRLFDVLNGVNLQMLIYLAALLEGNRFRPAGVLYMPASRPAVSVEKDLPAEQQKAAVSRELRMFGLLLEDPALLSAMEQDGVEQYISLSRRKEGKTTLVSREQIGQVLDYVKKTVGEMAVALRAGQVDDAPLKGEYDGCAYCPYFPVCCHEEADGGRLRMRLDREAVLRQLAKKDGKEEH